MTEFNKSGEPRGNLEPEVTLEDVLLDFDRRITINENLLAMLASELVDALRLIAEKAEQPHSLAEAITAMLGPNGTEEE